MRIALTGLGDIAQKAYLPVVANHPEIEPILCTRNPQTLSALAAKYRIAESYSSVDEAIAAGIEGAMIHSATCSHFALAQKLLLAGVAVFVDKPLSYSLAEVEQLLDLAAQKQLPLFVGFNRRYAPLIQPLSKVDKPLQVHWQKNRVALPAAPREFIFDDFIHLLDGLRFLSPAGDVDNLQVNAQFQGDLLAAIRVQWQDQGALLAGGMNRVSGLVEERLEFFASGEKWQLDGLTQGHHYHQGAVGSLGFSDWHSTLYKRGFETMLQEWVDVVACGGSDDSRLRDIHATHLLCEQVVSQIEH